ncbi:diguanylate cyclase domain-containing protein [methane-oxidizing endosymbiont of Gigantopelta aegis]|uniref:diguanylate cyclase domain-containing protein n=1 Tax=methane-oxidizing endosymbiont of Gigantopelta aegis TaxID=2794938 RepID=UPI0018DDC417|nr:PleD family two-component system response regulator [methane-oxidizing endosymbiont of Gigantopelta aegis]
MHHNGVILVVDDEPLNIKLLINILEAEYEVLFAVNGKKALELATEYQPDLVLLDIMMPGIDGYETCQELKANPVTQEIPVIFVSSQDSDDDEVKGLHCGAIDYINKPVKAPIVLSRIRNHLELKKARDLLKQQATIDALTGIANRRRFDEFLLQAWRAMQREAEPLSLIMIDIDHFKTYNDFYGHAAGDQCLRQVAQAMQAVITRPTDLLARYGGEEFVCVLPLTDQHGAHHVAENLRQAVEKLGLAHEKSQTTSIVTTSIGYACTIPTPDKLLSEWVNNADYALYQSKQSGRNRVSGFNPSKPQQ